MVRILQGVLAALTIVLSVNAAIAQDRPRVVAVNQALHYFAERLVRYQMKWSD